MSKKSANYIEINKQAYEILFSEYDLRAENKSPFETEVEILARDFLELAKSRFVYQINVLEVGPGSGKMLLHLEKQGCRTIAVELSPKVISVARKRSPNSIFISGNILEIDFSSEQFEIIYAGALIHLFPLNDARILIRKFYDWLKPQGVLFINTTMHEVSEEGIQTKLDYKGKVTRYRRNWIEQDFVTELKSAGFHIYKRLTSEEPDRDKKWVAYICTKDIFD